MNYTIVFLIPLIPLAVFLVLGLFYNRIKPTYSGLIGVSGLLISTLLSFKTAYDYFIVYGVTDSGYQSLVEKTVWMNFTENLRIDLGVLLDPISVMMLVVVSFVSLMVHIYSRGYMKGDGGYTKYFSFLSLFTFSMYGLVLATNLFQIYIFWELVGVSSYLLIGYYYTKPSAVSAAKKAFIVTRFADLFFLIGILVIGFYTGTYNFETLNDPQGTPILSWASYSFMGMSVLSWGLLLVFIGGAGKSAMFPLHIWLPDAMEGPTPVSALIHAATMVVAGIYLVARLFPMYYFVEEGLILQVVAFVGAFSALFAAIIAVTQNDIKRVLAYSTMSQLAYMMLALGVSGYHGEEGLGYMASMFHLFTHAMFKALLFLCAGSVIHAVHSNFLKDMGGLRRYMPVTHITFLIAALAISGIPPLAGFWSKDEILAAVYQKDMTLFVVGVFVAGLTAFYMFRIYFGIFWSKDPEYEQKPHESPVSMGLPMILLAIATIVVGFIPFSQFVTADRMPFDVHMNYYVAAISVLVGLIGIGVAWLFYKEENKLPEIIAHRLGRAYTWAYHKFYIDEVYLFIAKNILLKRVAEPTAKFDRNYVDGTMVGIGKGTVNTSEKIKGMQSGKVQDYAMAFVTGILILVIVFVYFWTN